MSIYSFVQRAAWLVVTACGLVFTINVNAESLTVLDTTSSHNYFHAAVTPGDPAFSAPQMILQDVPRFDSSLGILRQVAQRTDIIIQDVNDVTVTAYGVPLGSSNYSLDMRSWATASPSHIPYNGGLSKTTMIDTPSQTLGPGGLRQHHIDYNLPTPVPTPVRNFQAQYQYIADTVPAIDMNTFTTNHAAGPWSYELEFNPGVSGSYTLGQQFSVYTAYEQHTSISYEFDRVGSSSLTADAGTDLSDTQPSIVTNASSNATRASILDSEPLATSTPIGLDMTEMGAVTGGLAAADGFGDIVSDVLNVTGLDGTLHVIEMTYDDAGFANYQEEIDQAALNWFDPAAGTWRNAVLGNSNLGSLDLNDLAAVQAYLDAHRFAGNYQYNYLNSLAPGAGPELGAFGVDHSQNKVWAVIDHNSSFAAANNNPIPEPASLLLLLTGGSAGLIRSRGVRP
jgi:hypothetical protein